MIKKILKFVGIVILILIILVLGFFWNDAHSEKYDITIDDHKIPLFEEVAIDFKHQYNGKKSLPILLEWCHRPIYIFRSKLRDNPNAFQQSVLTRICV